LENLSGSEDVSRAWQNIKEYWNLRLNNYYAFICKIYFDSALEIISVC
jgi:hypothetical protein